MTGADPEVAQLHAAGGMSWSWDLDLDALLAAVGDRIAPVPAEREPAHREPAHREPAHREPAHREPAHREPAHREPAHREPAQREPAHREPAQREPTANGPAQDDSAQNEVAAGEDAVETAFADYLEAVDAGRSEIVPLSAFTGLIAESLPTSPNLAGWLAQCSASTADERALTGLASSYRRLASWAQAGELTAVAQLASRSAAADDRIGVDESGRPTRLSPDACGQVSLALTMSQASASWWTDLGVTLEWRLPETGIALRSGQIDLSRARAIAEATAVLDEEAARAVESRVLPKAGEQTLGQLRSALRRAVIAEDPHGAERRREEAERRAKVTLSPDAEGTAALAGYCLPGVRAAAAMARITALAQALKATGAGGGIDLLRSKVFLGLLLGTLPYIPPASDGPPDQGCPPDDSSPSDDPQPHESAPDDRVPWLSSASWPDVSASMPPGPAAMGHLLPVGGGSLDLKVPWSTLAGTGEEPGFLSRLGAITPTQARYLARLAARDPAADWRVIVIGPAGTALTLGRVRRRSARAGPGRPDPSTDDPHYCGLVKRVTVTVAHEDLAIPPGAASTRTGDAGLPEKLTQVHTAASTAVAAVASTAVASTAVASTADAGGCAHTGATEAYRPSRRLAEYVTARDLTCRFPTCRQPASRCDLDHTEPYDQGGVTCACNLGALCRYHHQLKQHPRWQLAQPEPGVFTWTTPAGRTYITRPDSHAA